MGQKEFKGAGSIGHLTPGVIRISPLAGMQEVGMLSLRIIKWKWTSIILQGVK